MEFFVWKKPNISLRGSVFCIVKILMSDFLTISASVFVAKKQSMQPHINGCLAGWVLKIPRTSKTKWDWGNGMPPFPESLELSWVPHPRDQEELVPSRFNSNTLGCCEDQASSPALQWGSQKFALQTSGSLRPRKMNSQGLWKAEWAMRNDAALNPNWILGFRGRERGCYHSLQMWPSHRIELSTKQFLSHRSSCPLQSDERLNSAQEDLHSCGLRAILFFC